MCGSTDYDGVAFAMWYFGHVWRVGYPFNMWSVAYEQQFTWCEFYRPGRDPILIEEIASDRSEDSGIFVVKFASGLGTRFSWSSQSTPHLCGRPRGTRDISLRVYSQFPYERVYVFFFLYLISWRTCAYFTYLGGKFDEKMDFRLQWLLVDGRVVRPTPYGRVVVFRLRHEPQHGPRGKPPAICRHGLDVRLDAVHDRRAGSIGPSDLWQ